MKLILKNQVTTAFNSDTCAIAAYPFHEKMLDMAIATLTGRYPTDRRVVNNECDEIAYVLEGQGKLVVEGVEHILNPGDAVLIQKGEQYYWEGHLKLVLSCRPAWSPGQHQMVD